MFHLEKAFAAARPAQGASRPGLPHDFYVRYTKLRTSYILPSYEKVRNAKIFVTTEEEELQRVIAVTNLPFEIERYLPPSGGYFDQYAIGNAIDTPGMNPDGKCLSCYRIRHGTEGPRCQKKCLVCDTVDHLGMPCAKLYLESDWWKEHGRTLGTRIDIQIRPSLAEWAYLAIAEVVEGITTSGGPIVVRWDHPIVKEFYRGSSIPHLMNGPPPTLPLQPRRRRPKKSSSPRSQQHQAGAENLLEAQDKLGVAIRQQEESQHTVSPDAVASYRLGGTVPSHKTPSDLGSFVPAHSGIAPLPFDPNASVSTKITWADEYKVIEDHHVDIQMKMIEEINQQRRRIVELEKERDAQTHRADAASEENKVLRHRLEIIIAVASEPGVVVGNKRARHDDATGIKVEDE
ncbi:hypothetical protein NX059_006498 [Plenodomus lindquistii]|nr:hypothetical protein NX059_006498 [Plenodomus lindquistii]